MKMDFMFLLSSFAITGAFEGEENKSKVLLESLGFSADDLTKVEAGELALDDAKKAWMGSFETSLRGRIEQEVVDRKKSEIFNAAHSKNEKLVCEKLGLNYDDYKDTEARGRIERILTDGAAQHKTQLEQLKGQFNGVDENKLKEVEANYIARMQEMQNLHETSKQELQSQLQEQLNQNKKIVVDNYKSSARNSFLKSIENPAFDFSTMEKIVAFDAMKYGIEIEEVDGEKVAFLTKEGAKVMHPTKPQNNLTYKDYLHIVAEENNFVKRSNGGSNGKFELGAEEKETLKKKGINTRALAEREKHLANLQNK